MKKFAGQIEIEYRFSQHLGPRFDAAGVTLDLCTNGHYSFKSEVKWPDKDYTPAVERGARDGLTESGIDPDQGVSIILKDISFHAIDSCERAFYLAAKCAAKSRKDINRSVSQNNRMQATS